MIGAGELVFIVVFAGSFNKWDADVDIDRAKEVLSAVADGIDPATGEVYPPQSPYQHPDVVRALYTVLPLLNGNGPSGSRPARAGTSWSNAEDAVLAAAFRRGMGVAKLAKNHRRTVGAIQSRLEKLGLIDGPSPQEAESQVVASAVGHVLDDDYQQELVIVDRPVESYEIDRVDWSDRFDDFDSAQWEHHYGPH